MFELNLIKDKAKARQRRRVIFMSIMLILLMCGLVSLFVGSMIYKEQTDINRVVASVAQLTTANDDHERRLNEDRPKAIKRMNGLINACAESESVRNKRPHFAPALNDIFQMQPGSSRFWYTSIDFQLMRPSTPSSTGAVMPPDLLGLRTFNANGHVQIVDSDTRTQQALAAMSEKMQGVAILVGVFPTYTSQPDQSMEGRGQGNNEETRYVRFDVRAQQYYGGSSGAGTP